MERDIGRWATEMGCDRGDERRATDRIAHATCPNFVHLYILVVNESLLIEVRYTGRFWLNNATKNNKRGSSNEYGDEQQTETTSVRLTASSATR